VRRPAQCRPNSRMANGRTASAPAAVRLNTKSPVRETELRPMTVPSDVAPGGGAGRLTSGSRRPWPRLLASCLPGPDRRMTSCSHGDGGERAERVAEVLRVDAADLIPLLQGGVSVTKSALERLRKA
jgi:hypothetical protein